MRIEKGIRDLQTPRRKINFSNRAHTLQTPESKETDNNKATSTQQTKKNDSILSNVVIDRDGLSESDYQQLLSIKENAPSVKNSKKMDINSLMEDMKLTASDRTFIMNEMNNINNQNNSNATNNATNDPFSRLERILSQDSSIMDLLDQWTKQVESTLGKSITDPTLLSEEELKKIPPAPEKLQEVIKFMFFADK